MNELKKVAMWVGIFIGSGLCFLAILFIAASVLTSGLKKPIEKQLAAIRTEDYASAYAYTTRAFQDATTFEAFKKFVNDYSALRNNESISFDERSIEDGVGVVHATLISRSKAKTPIYYRLIKENDVWKIENMVINPDPDIDSQISSRGKVKAENTHETVATETTHHEPTAITHTFNEPRYHFSIGYPGDWQTYQPASGMVVFVDKNNPDAGQVSLSLQTLATYRNRSVDKVVAEIGKALNQNATDVQFVDDASIPTLQGKLYQGRYVVYSFTLNNQPMSQLSVIYFKKPSKAMYFLQFIAPLAQFNKQLPIVKSMVESFTAQ